VNLSTIITAGFLVMLAVLGHTLWHGGEVAIAGFFVNVFTGAHVTG
jgi:hypothetical protein